MMMLSDMTVGILPYSDGSGFHYEATIDKDQIVTLEQCGHGVTFTRAEWLKIKVAIDALWETAAAVQKLDAAE